MQLYNDDCLKVMKTLPDKSVDCIVTSPPYWKGFEYEAYFNLTGRLSNANANVTGLKQNEILRED